MKKFKQAQKFRVISDQVAFYTTAKKIRIGVGDFTRFNAALMYALAGLEGKDFGKYRGFATSYNGVPVQLDVIDD